jgi:hypothetical protein
VEQVILPVISNHEKQHPRKKCKYTKKAKTRKNVFATINSQKKGGGDRSADIFSAFSWRNWR